MSQWVLIDEDAPHSKEVMLWLKAPEGTDIPIGPVIASYIENSVFTGWSEKSVSGNLNTGLRKDLITHYREIGDGPDHDQ